MQRYNGFKLYISLLKRWEVEDLSSVDVVLSLLTCHITHYCGISTCSAVLLESRDVEMCFLDSPLFFFFFSPSAKINLAIGFVHEKDGGFPACATLSRGLHAQFAANVISIGCAPCGDAEYCSINCILGCA